MLGPDKAAVTDNIVNSSVAVDADTGVDLELLDPEPDFFQMTLERREGLWKVVFYV